MLQAVSRLGATLARPFPNGQSSATSAEMTNGPLTNRCRTSTAVQMLALVIAAMLPLSAAPFRLLAVGDSLSEEYRFEIPFSAPDLDPYSKHQELGGAA